MLVASGRSWKYAALLALALLPAVGRAQAQEGSRQGGPAQGQDDDPSVIKMTTRLVELNVTVLDHQHHPLRGLTANQFQVFDNGVRQKIVHFSANAGVLRPQNPSRLAISNRASGADDTPGATVILLDETLLDAPAGTSLAWIAPIRSARLSIVSFLAHMKPGEQVGIYSLRTWGVVVIHDFTDDPATLIAAAQTLEAGGVARAANAADVRRSARNALADWSRYPSVRPGGDKYRGGIQPDWALLRGGFQQIVEHLRTLPGRKRLVWISTTFPVSSMDMEIMGTGRDANLVAAPSLEDPTPGPHHPDAQGFYEGLRGFARWLSNADVSVYPIDAFGLTRDGSAVEEWAAADMIATETGGQAIFNSNALDEHLQEIVDEDTGTYQIGYYPGDAAWDGKYHRVQVKLSPSHKEAALLCRKGYYAVDQAVSDDPDAPLNDAARSVVESAGIGVTANLPENPLQPGPQDMAVKIDAAQVHFEHTSDRSKASIDIAFVQVGRDGKIVTGKRDRVLLSLTAENYESSLADGWFYRKHLWIEPKAEKLRILVRDLATGTIGSVTVPVHSLGYR